MKSDANFEFDLNDGDGEYLLEVPIQCTVERNKTKGANLSLIKDKEKNIVEMKFV